MQMGNNSLARFFWQKLLDTYPNDWEAILALLFLADLENDQTALQRLSARMLVLKRERTWTRFFEVLNSQKDKDIFFLSRNLWEFMPLIGKGLELESRVVKSRSSFEANGSDGRP